ncbi:MAG TPA: BadF/BadG/BcrA/BcrD ATPase family protein [Terriglobia bacterium]|nr:BadF/BadG/BcrA/BcrD ATPase family protein [Terriglobia bacterium]
MALFLGIDGGGSRTQACLGDERGGILAKAEAGPSNPLKVGIEGARKELLRAARAVLRKGAIRAVRDEPPSAGAVRGRHRPEPLLQAVCAGVAGVDRPAVSRPLLAWLRKAIPARHYLVTTDAAVALHAALGTAAGMIVVSGTGSIAYARNRRGETLRAGGWGAAFDDLGSGYDLGRKAIMAALRDFDGRGEHTVLTSRICRALKLSDITQIVLKKLDPQQVAALFPLVSEAARQGDPVARRLCAQAAYDLAQLARALGRRLGRHGVFPVVCAGGVFNSSPTLRRSFARYVHQYMPSARVRLLQREPVEGALAMARELAA